MDLRVMVAMEATTRRWWPLAVSSTSRRSRRRKRRSGWKHPLDRDRNRRRNLKRRRSAGVAFRQARLALRERDVRNELVDADVAAAWPVQRVRVRSEARWAKKRMAGPRVPVGGRKAA